LSEEWRAIPGFPGYEASSEGRVRRSEPSKSDRAFNAVVGRVLRPAWSAKQGDPKARLKLELYVDGRRYHVCVHIAVCLAFHGPRPTPKHVCAHFPERDVSNNRPGNLRWATRSQNAFDMTQHCTNPSQKLTPAQARMVRGSREKGVDIAARLGVTPSAISHIRRGKNHAFS
jgi:HNH endonuclease/NUMOD4 motif-containing protein